MKESPSNKEESQQRLPFPVGATGWSPGYGTALERGRPTDTPLQIDSQKVLSSNTHVGVNVLRYEAQKVLKPQCTQPTKGLQNFANQKMQLKLRTPPRSFC